MATHLRAARTIAVLLLLQMLSGPVVNFVLLKPVSRSVFLADAAPHAMQIAVGVVLGLAMNAYAVGIAIVAWPVFSRYSRAMASWLFALAIVGVAVAVLEYVNVLSMLSLSQAFVKADASADALFQTLAGIAAAPRIWAHFLGLIVAGTVALTLYATLFRFALVPRLLAGFGIAASASEIIGVAVTLFGQPVVFPLIAPLGLAHIALIVWLIVKGFAERDPAPQTPRG